DDEAISCCERCSLDDGGACAATFEDWRACDEGRGRDRRALRAGCALLAMAQAERERDRGGGREWTERGPSQPPVPPAETHCGGDALDRASAVFGRWVRCLLRLIGEDACGDVGERAIRLHGSSMSTSASLSSGSAASLA